MEATIIPAYKRPFIQKVFLATNTKDPGKIIKTAFITKTKLAIFFNVNTLNNMSTETPSTTKVQVPIKPDTFSVNEDKEGLYEVVDE